MLLNCHTYYSFNYGTLSPERLLDAMEGAGYSRFAVTEINHTGSAMEIMHLALKKPRLTPVIGVDFRNNNQTCYLGYAQSNQGFLHLNQFLTQHLHQGMDFPARPPQLEEVVFVYPFRIGLPSKLRPDEYIGLKPQDLTRWSLSKPSHPESRWVALKTVSFLRPPGFQTHRALRAIGENELLARLHPSQTADPSDFLLPAKALKNTYKDHGFLLKNTEKLLASCSIAFDFNANQNKSTYTGSSAQDHDLLDQLCQEGIGYRFSNPGPKIYQRVQMELDLIKRLNFASYFLLNWDMVRYAQSKNYYYVGRGSGANSMVAYVLRITDVNPIDLDLYFERFINPYRSSPPDFDIDFNWTDRDDVTRYLFETHGYDHVALLGTYSTYKHKAAYRELGKVFGLPADEIADLQYKVRQYSNEKGQLSSQVISSQFDQVEERVHQFARVITGFPSHLSVHSSGILITEKPLSAFSATFMPPKGFATTQFDMYIAEDAGLYKFDVLSQRGLGKIKDTVQLIQENRGEEVDPHAIEKFKSDAKVKQLLRVGDCTGCFYIESPAMRSLLTKLRAEDYNRLVAASSIIRPGVSQSGMMHEYIRRFQEPDRAKWARNQLPELYDLLEDTFGVMVYQEDVLKVAHYFAGLSLAEADVLRRGMSWKFRERNDFDLIKERFIANCLEKGYPREKVDEIWKQIESFGNYAFAKGHSASYAVESFQALYLKAHYPIEYMVATVNNGGGFYRPELYLHEAKRHGAKLELPCVNQSEAGCSVRGEVVFIGLGFVHEVSHELIKSILKNRMEKGDFKDLPDFIKRVNPGLEQTCTLIRVGCFRFTGKAKKALLWDAHFILRKQPKPSTTDDLFEMEVKEHKLPPLWKHPLEDAYDEMELLGFTISESPFMLVDRSGLPRISSEDFEALDGKGIDLIGYLIHRKVTSTYKKERMNFGTFIGLDGNWIDTIHWPKNAKAYPFTGPGVYRIKGKLTNDYGFYAIEVSWMKRVPNRNILDENQKIMPHTQLISQRRQGGTRGGIKE